MLRGISAEVHVVKGDFDTISSFPEKKVVTIGNFKFGLCHGHQVIPWDDPEGLAIVQRELGCDVLITGHTHKFRIFEHEKHFFVNPGSATGAYSGLESNVVPTFVLMDVQANNIITYVYTLKDDDDLKVEKIEWSN